MPWPTPLSALIASLALALLLALATPGVLRTLPEPPAEDADGKPPYATLATPRFVGLTTLACLACGLVAFGSTPPAHWPAWCALAGVNVLACAIDAVTTWLPRVLSWAGWAVAGAGVVVLAAGTGSWTPLVAAGAGAVAVGGFFHLVWRFTGALGYGDVRLAATIGAVTALDSASLAAWAILLGTGLGAGLGVAHRVRGGQGAFAYGPGLLAGAFVALPLESLLG